MENENNKERHHSGHRSHHHHHHHGHSGSQSSSRERSHSDKKISGRNSDSQKKVVDDRMKEVRWEKVFKPIIEGVMVVGFIILIGAIVWFLTHPEDGTRKSNNITSQEVIEKQEEIKADLEENDLKKELETAMDRINDLEKRIEDLEEQIQ